MSNDNAWKLERDADGIAWLTLDKPGSSANTLGHAVLAELATEVDALERDVPRGLVLISGKSSGFAAGADINEFTQLQSAAQAEELVRGVQRLFQRIESLPCPSVAALHGFALGGGLELALACRYRVAVQSDRLSLGLPEVQLGIQPGFGGTVRSVRLLGVRAAMDLMLTGKPWRAERALHSGLIDRLVPESELRSAARALVLAPPAPQRAPLLDRLLGCGPLRLLLKPALLRQVAAKARRDHYPAPYSMIDQWAAYGVAGEQAFEAEARAIAALFMSDSARGLIRVFQLQDRLKALGGKADQSPQHVHVVGAGVMGGDIAAWCALRGLDVTLQDRDMKFIAPALQRAAALFDKRLRDPLQRAAATARLQADVNGDGVPRADLLIEAIYENLEAKQQLYAAAEPRLPAQAVLATNTSSIALELLGTKLADPGRLLGLHFFNPVSQMPLVEVIHSDATRAEPLAAALAFARRIDKLPLPCRSGPGFLVNRVLFPYLLEALHAAGDGVPLAVIDAAALDFGMPMGPIELADVVGLDVVLHVGEIITGALNRAEPPMFAKVRELVAAKQLGRKSGGGLYAWADGKAVKTPGGTPVPADLQDRLLLPLVNECVACLREGIVSDADLVDAGVVFGTGFAPFRGGPLHYARTRGVAAVVARLDELAAKYGARFRPDAGFSQLAVSASAPQ
jgi:3-hydroxyacyl-CoA dehydrogenase/enoyl-CoA hydratase/3-hydroxybutyryl-CoA epimerase